MGLKLNPTTGLFDLVGKSPTTYNDKFSFIFASLSAYDKVVSIQYADSGLLTQRISSVAYSSDDFPDADLVKTVYWLDVGTMNQRVDREEYVGAIFSPDNLRKVYNYSLVGIRYNIDGFYYEIF